MDNQIETENSLICMLVSEFRVELNSLEQRKGENDILKDQTVKRRHCN